MQNSVPRHANGLKDSFLTSWAASPGVAFGCEVVKGTGFGVTVLPGKFFSQNGVSAEITHPLVNIVNVAPAQEFDRLDYVVAIAEGSGVVIRYICGVESLGKMTQLQHTLKDGVVLSRLIVKYPTISPSESVFIYNIIPADGEPVILNCRPINCPDGARTRFKFPFKCPEGYSIGLRVYGIPQCDGVDFLIDTATHNGAEVSEIVLDEVPPIGADIAADLYAGKVKV